MAAQWLTYFRSHKAKFSTGLDKTPAMLKCAANR